ncbi:MAG TPA: type II toxin-antitoxin system RelE/ParE family toxin [Salinivirgaceae bacterium]|nr:type II toxin-antitoxin system RelE/ParE family toxin [Salinivirgaceae bacterium]HQA75965.1 type II toxin-antitoxin system RelE/ParE family toxin [Salinivirgaceae bacterium]
MKILFKESFLIRLESQIEYISLDSPKRARKFKNDLLDRIKEIHQNPYKYRKSIYFDNISIRDLIFKGYTIVFRINEDQIEIFGFLKHQEKPID